MSFYKALWLEVIFVGIIVLGYFSSDIISFIKRKNLSYTPSDGCVLNVGDCSLTLEDGSTLLVSLEPKIIPPLQSASFVVRNGGANSVKASIKGLNMEMGIYEQELKKRPDGAFEFKAMVPSCSVDMKWRLDVTVDKEDKNYGGGFIFWSKN